jgi:hypothetical protein
MHGLLIPFNSSSSLTVHDLRALPHSALALLCNIIETVLLQQVAITPDPIQCTVIYPQEHHDMGACWSWH